MAQNSISKLWLFSAVFFLIGLFFILIAPTQHNEKKFVSLVEAEFGTSNNGEVYVKDVTNFDWDTVCYIYPELLPSTLERLFNSSGDDQYLQKVKRSLKRNPNNFWDQIKGINGPTFLGAHIFLKDSTLARIYEYKAFSANYLQGEYSSYLSNIEVSGKKRFFINEEGFEQDLCHPRTSAVFKISDKNQEFIVLAKKSNGEE